MSDPTTTPMPPTPNAPRPSAAAPAVEPVPASDPAPPAAPQTDEALDKAFEGFDAEEGLDSAMDFNAEPDPAPEPSPEPDPAPAPEVATPTEPEPPTVAAEPAPAPPAAPAPETAAPTPEEVVAQERAALLQQRRNLELAENDFTNRHKEGLRDADEIADELAGLRAEEEFKVDFPDIDLVMETKIKRMETAIKSEMEQNNTFLQEQVRTGKIDVDTAIDLANVAAQHTDIRLIAENPSHLYEWIDTLPYSEGAKAMEAVQKGTPEAASEWIGKFKEAKNITHYSELGGTEGGAPAAAPITPPAPEAPAAPIPASPQAPIPVPANQERLAAAEAVPSEGTPLPSNSPAAGDDDKGLDRAFAAIPDEDT